MSALLTYLFAFSTGERISARLTAMRKFNVSGDGAAETRFVQNYDPSTQ
jgi:hypothetical protein